MPQWNPTTLEEVKYEDIDRLFQPFSPELELQVPSDDSNRWAVTPLESHTSLMDPAYI
jgi:3-hydroxyisobutyryl-CoA hydrolase